MTDSTPRYGLTTLNDGEELSALDYRFGTQDRILLDRLLRYAVEGHVHTGIPAPTAVEITGLTLNVQSTDGMFPAGRTVYYRFGVVDPRGQEFVATATHTVVTPQAVTTPAPPTSLTADAALGTLAPGDYMYALTAYVGSTGSETLASRTISGTLPQGGRWTIALPAPPSGADGWNIYRRAPGDLEPTFLTTAPIDTGYVDDGAIRPTGLRPLPSANTTLTTCAVLIDFSTGIPAGYTVRIYRTLDQSDWTRSLVGWVATTTFLDTGHATQVGMPLAQSAAVGGAPKIRWNENTEGTLPPGVFNTSQIATFNVAGPLTPGLSPWQWICEYDEAVITSLRASLGRGSVPAVDEVRATVLVRRAYDTEWIPILTSADADVYATVPPGDTIGSLFPLDWTFVNNTLQVGDALRLVVLQAGGGATPTDSDLSLVVTMLVRHGSATATHVWRED